MIHMLPCLVNYKEIQDSVSVLVGSHSLIQELFHIKALQPFDENVVDFFNDLSKVLLSQKRTKMFSDITTFAFWIRKASIKKYQEKYQEPDGTGKRYFGRGRVFHIAPSNVPVNYAYSLAVGLLAGNINIVRVSSKDFEQVQIINQAIKQVLADYPMLVPYITVLRYGHCKKVNDYFSAMADLRVIWGGDKTIQELRQSPIPVRAGEITFADRYSLAVINAEDYLNIEDKEKTARDFYNDTYLTDQNACTSPRIVVWTGSRIEEAKEVFWENLFGVVQEEYTIQPVQAVDKLTNLYLAACKYSCKISNEGGFDNRLVCVQVENPDRNIMEYKGNSGYFYEYICSDICEIRNLIGNRCQTIGYIGGRTMLTSLLESGLQGVDRIVPVGKTMDFDLIWDGYDLYYHMTRIIIVL